MAAGLLAGCAAAPPAPPSSTPPPVASPRAAAAVPAAAPAGRVEAQVGALPAAQASCRRLATLPDAPLEGHVWAGRPADWRPWCERILGLAPGDTAGFTAALTLLRPVPVRDGERETGLFTGYFEPQVRGSRARGGRYTTPIHAPPRRLLPSDDRAAIEGGALAGRADVLLWLDDPVDAFFLHVQGSGVAVLPDGQRVRLSYAGDNGKTYTAIGRVLIDRGAIPADKVSMQSIRAWLAANPAEAPAVMQRNARYIFFREAPATAGPPGAGAIPLTPGHSLAVDRAHIPLHIPVWLEGSRPDADPARGDRPFRALLIAQDTGAAIKGKLRGDVFWGAGADAAAIAGRMQHQQRLWVLLPQHLAGRLGPHL